MPKILVLYHSTYGHVEAMAEAVARSLSRLKAKTAATSNGDPA